MNVIMFADTIANQFTRNGMCKVILSATRQVSHIGDISLFEDFPSSESSDVQISHRTRIVSRMIVGRPSKLRQYNCSALVSWLTMGHSGVPVMESEATLVAVEE